MTYTHLTKKGFGGLLAAGIECYIVKMEKKSVAVILKGRNNLSGNPPLFWGKIQDLNPLNPTP